mmetsp:Transcript_5999/g.15286  ORF Transcript_5999/g.15286 Transcript_5999/m.15286 type:complete len:366 (-) Transcript_5999:120-1217(-)
MLARARLRVATPLPPRVIEYIPRSTPVVDGTDPVPRPMARSWRSAEHMPAHVYTDDGESRPMAAGILAAWRMASTSVSPVHDETFDAGDGVERHVKPEEAVPHVRGRSVPLLLQQPEARESRPPLEQNAGSLPGYPYWLQHGAVSTGGQAQFQPIGGHWPNCGGGGGGRFVGGGGGAVGLAEPGGAAVVPGVIVVPLVIPGMLTCTPFSAAEVSGKQLLLGPYRLNPMDSASPTVCMPLYSAFVSVSTPPARFCSSAFHTCARTGPPPNARASVQVEPTVVWVSCSVTWQPPSHSDVCIVNDGVGGGGLVGAGVLVGASVSVGAAVVVAVGAVGCAVGCRVGAAVGGVGPALAMATSAQFQNSSG